MKKPVTNFAASVRARLLADHVIARHYPNAGSYRGLFEKVIQRQAELVAQWLLVRLGQSALVQAWLQSGLRSDAERTVECDQAA